MIKKKVAFCFSGQARIIKWAYPNLKKYYFDPLGRQEIDYDIFCSVQKEENWEDVKVLKPTILKLWDIKDMKKTIFPLIKKFNEKNFKNFIFINAHIDNIFYQLFLINDSFKNLKEYKEKNKIEYEYYVRIRFDFIPFEKFSNFQIKDNEIIIPELEKTIYSKDKKYISDAFCITKNFNNFKIYSSLIENINLITFNKIKKINLFILKYILRILIVKKINSKKNSFLSLIYKYLYIILDYLFLSEIKRRNKKGVNIEDFLETLLKKNKIKVKERKMKIIILKQSHFFKS